MNTTGWIITGLVVGGAAYLIHKNTSKKGLTTKISESLRKQVISSAEDVEELKMSDVAAWFKSLSLVKGKHLPFLAKASKFAEIVSIPYKENSFILGVYDESSDELTHLKLIHAQKVDGQLAQVIGNEEIVVFN